ncbi:MAG: hypothetical protein A2X86_18545 [Bdellovibrionales bacterium GWA2_49_15]|nr:MAG: hypothetical protein A2X86_18545 [Bdellovibrionales bacterium GWA2_49_15]HAZ11725.1 hypothetical protein [Bdellovibrionales bacterium]
MLARKLSNILDDAPTKKVALFYLIISIFVQIDKVLLGKFAIGKEHDTFDSFWPFQQAIADRVFSFKFPGWFPDYLGGIAFNDMDINWASIPVLISGIVPQPYSYLACMSVQFLIAGLGTYLFMTYFFPEVKRHVCFVAGLVWAMGVISKTYWSVMDLASIPLLLYSTDILLKTVVKRTRIYALLGLLVCASNIYLAKGSIFIAFFQLIFIFLTNTGTHKNKFFPEKKVILVLSTFAIFWISDFLVNSPVIVSLLATSRDGMRSLVDFVPPHKSALVFLAEQTLVFLKYPMWYSAATFGTPATLILFYSLMTYRKGSNLEKKLLIFLLCVLVYFCFVDPAVWYQHLRQHLPLREFRLSRFILVGPFVLLICLSCRLDSFLQWLQTGPAKQIFLFLVALTLFNCSRHLRDSFPSNYFEMILTVSSMLFFVLIVLLRKRFSERILELVVLLLIGERILNANAIKLAASHPPSFVHFFESDDFAKVQPSQRYDYRISFVNWPPTAGLWNGYQVTGGYASQYPRRYAKFWNLLTKSSSDFNEYPYKAYLEDSPSLLETEVPVKIESLPFNPDLLAQTNTRYLFTRNEIANPEQSGLIKTDDGEIRLRKSGLGRLGQVFERVFQQIDYYIYEIKDYAPRCQIAYNYEILNSHVEFDTTIKGKLRKELQSSVLLMREDLDHAIANSIEREVVKDPTHLPHACTKIESYDNDKIVIHENLESSAFLTLNETYTKEWEASINGKTVPIFPGYGFLRTIQVPKGSVKIVFEYAPKYLRASYFLSLGALFLYLILFVVFLALKPKKGAT